MNGPQHIFILHADADDHYLQSLMQQFTPLRIAGLLEYWSRFDLTPGASISQSMRERLQWATVILPLLSADYLADERCRAVQSLARDLGKLIIPVLIRPCLWQYDPVLADLQPLPGAEIPVSGWSSQEDAMALVVRHFAPHTTQQKQQTKKVWDTGIRTILFLGANPRMSETDLSKEVREIEERLLSGKQRDSFQLEKKLAVRTRDLQQHLQNAMPHIVHFSGHGTAEKGLIFEDEAGNPKTVGDKALEGLFALFPSVECVVLNACFSAHQAEAIRRSVPCVIGMKDNIPNKDALAFSSGFYLSLAGGGSYEQAFRFGKNSMELEDPRAAWMPVML